MANDMDLTVHVLLPALFALTSWWFGTGIILWLVRRPGQGFARRMGLMTVVLGLSVLLADHSMRAPGSLNAYLGFASAIAMWAWHELAFLSGWITGPRREPLSPGLGLRARFTQSVAVILHHELALLANFALLYYLQLGQPNHVAICTFALLWCMRLSAKLNLFFGVPEVGEHFLPRQITYLGSYFRRGRVSGVFFLTMGLSSGAWIWIVWQANSGAASLSTGWVLLAALLGLAIVEHLLMVLPLPLQKLWGWAMHEALHEALPEPTPAKPDPA